MASPAEIAPQLPDTLPEDFGEWDGGAPPATLPVHSDDQQAESEVGKNQEAPAEAAQPEAVPEAALEATSQQEAPRPAPSPSAAKIFAEGEAFLQRQKFKNGVVDHIPEIPVPPQTAQAQANGRPVQGAAPLTTTPAPTPMRRTTDPVIPKQAPAPVVAAPVLRESDEALFRSFRGSAVDDGVEEKSDSKKWIKVGGISAGALLVVAFLIILRFDPALLGMGTHTVEAPSSTSVPPTVNPDADANKPSPATPMTLGKLLSANAQPAPGAQQQPAATVTPTTATTPATPKPQTPQVESAMMDDQLNAPKRIPTDLGKRNDDAAPPSETINGLEGSNSALGSVFGGKAKQKVAPAKMVSISAGVAGGLLIQRTAPLYPQIAKLARVSGTVVLKATITTTGTLADIQVVSGPDMLQHAALDAVKNWRYRPYTVNNVPTSVETTVNVIFSLNQ